MDENKNILEDNDFKDLDSFIGLKNENAFRVPDDYFTNLSDRITSKCYKEQERTHFQKLILKFIKPSVSISFGIMVISIIAFVIIFNKPNIQPNKNSVSINQTEKTAEDYLIEIENVDDTFIIDATTEDSTENDNIFLTNDVVAYESSDVSNNKKLNNTSSDTLISKEDIINYLVEENIDPNDL